jgi:hypothetical protein
LCKVSLTWHDDAGPAGERRAIFTLGQLADTIKRTRRARRSAAIGIAPKLASERRYVRPVIHGDVRERCGTNLPGNRAVQPPSQSSPKPRDHTVIFRHT